MDRTLEGDYDNIVEYFSRLLNLQRRKTFPLHNYFFTVNYITIVDDADKGIVKKTTEYPEKEMIDRIRNLSFIVEEGDSKFELVVSRDNISFCDLEKDDFPVEKFVELLDSSTFRFF